MTDDLESITNKLTVRGHDVVAVVHSRIAQALHAGITLTTTKEPLLQNPSERGRSYEEDT